MKKVSLLFLIVISNNIIAQTNVADKAIDNGVLYPAPKFEQLNRTEITSNNLINRSFLFIDHTKFYATASDTNNYGAWLQLYLEIFNGYFDNANITPLDSIKSKVNQYNNTNVVPLLIMDLEYQQLKESVFRDSLLVLNEDGVFKDVFPRLENPYQTQRIVSFAPGTNSIYKNDYTFLVSKDFFFTNQATLPSNVLIDFGDGNGFIQVL